MKERRPLIEGIKAASIDENLERDFVYSGKRTRPRNRPRPKFPNTATRRASPLSTGFHSHRASAPSLPTR